MFFNTTFIYGVLRRNAYKLTITIKLRGFSWPTMAELTHLYSTGATSAGKIVLDGCCVWSSETREVEETSFSKLLFGAPYKYNFGSVFDFQTGRAVEKDLHQTVPKGKHEGLRALCVRGMEK